jgi:hypothetical protein
MMKSKGRVYIPGACNIGKAEMRRRLALGWLGLIAGGVLWAVFFSFDTAAAWRLLMFFPAALAAAGFLQSYWSFCAGYGLSGVFNVGPDFGKTETVEQAEFRRKDRRTALLIIGLSLLVGAVVAAGAYFTAPRAASG